MWYRKILFPFKEVFSFFFLCSSNICFFFLFAHFLLTPWYQHCFFQLNNRSFAFLLFLLVHRFAISIVYISLESILLKREYFIFCSIILETCDGSICLFARRSYEIKCSFKIELFFRPHQPFYWVLLFYLLLPGYIDGVKGSICDTRWI